MSKSAPKSTKEKSKSKLENRSRILPVLIAGFICLILAVSSGYAAWLFFGKKSNGGENRAKLSNWATDLTNNKKENIVETPLPTPTIEPEKTPTPLPTVSPTPEPTVEPTQVPKEIAIAENPQGTVMVEGGLVEIGGEKNRPVRKEAVEDFFISETEVTNAQYAEYVKATGKQSPPGWKKSEFPKGMDDFPVVGISYFDAIEYCKWLTKNSGNEVRLPTETEWERAARGNSKNKYPWGDKWDKKATPSRETGGKVGKVKGSEINKSEYGAYDMVGSVWEWTTSQAVEANGKVLKVDGMQARIVKGGSAKDFQSLISNTSWALNSESTKSSIVGFRYVVEIKKINKQ